MRVMHPETDSCAASPFYPDNVTLIGASANVVAAGIWSSHGKDISFVTFMRYGLPFTICQLVAFAVYVVCMYYLIR
jgi:Na+/H+ antiporter NhaD/arsenite permease-like protein